MNARRRGPRSLAEILPRVTEALEPAGALATIQARWPTVVGDVIAAHARPVSERDGVLEVACDEAVWASELDLMAPDLIIALNGAIAGGDLHALRCRTSSRGEAG